MTSMIWESFQNQLGRKEEQMGVHTFVFNVSFTLIEVKQSLTAFGGTHFCPPMAAHGSGARPA